MSVKPWTLAIVILFTAAAGLGVASAAETGWYVGGSWGLTTFNHGTSDFDDGSLAGGRVDDGDSGWKLFGGYRFARHWALEGGYALLNGDYDGETTFSGGVSDGSGFLFAPGGVGVDLDRPQSVFLSVVGMLPVGKNLALCGKVGVQTWESDVTLFDSDGIRENTESGIDPIVGLGADYRIAKRLALRAEWERFMDIAGNDIDLMSVGLTYRFGSK